MLAIKSNLTFGPVRSPPLVRKQRLEGNWKCKNLKTKQTLVAKGLLNSTPAGQKLTFLQSQVLGRIQNSISSVFDLPELPHKSLPKKERCTEKACFQVIVNKKKKKILPISLPIIVIFVSQKSRRYNQHMHLKTSNI